MWPWHRICLNALPLAFFTSCQGCFKQSSVVHTLHPMIPSSPILHLSFRAWLATIAEAIVCRQSQLTTVGTTFSASACSTKHGLGVWFQHGRSLKGSCINTVAVDFSNFSNLLPEILAILPTGCRDESTTVQRMRHRLRQTTTCKTRNMQAMTYQVNGTLRLRRRPPDGWK